MKKNKKKEIINWHRIITLAAAGNYISKQLEEEVSKIKVKSAKKKTNGK